MDIEELFTKIAASHDVTRDQSLERRERIEFIPATPRDNSTARLSLAFGTLQILGRLCLTLLTDQGTP